MRRILASLRRCGRNAMHRDSILTPMQLCQIAPELRGSIRKLPRMPVSSRGGRWLIRAGMTLAMAGKHYDGVQIDKRATGDGVRLRICIPEVQVTNAALLWIHGGGLVTGNAAQDDAFCAGTARELGIVVVSTEYRLAPEFPYPAGLDDCSSAWVWLQETAQQLRIDPQRVAVGGQSAGGGLAASLVQRIRDTGGVQPVAQWLFCPMLDDRTAARRELDDIKHFVWDNRQNRTGWRAYLGTEPGTDNVPEYAVPARRDDLRALPWAWIGIGDIDLFFNEARVYAERLNAAGVHCALDIVPGAPHGFERIAGNTKLAQDYLFRGRDWLRQQLARR